MIAKLCSTEILRCCELDETGHDEGCGLLRITVSTPEQLSEVSLDITICTPDWLTHHIEKQGPELGQYHLIVDSINMQAAILFLSKRIEQQQADDWQTLVNRLSRLGRPVNFHEAEGELSAVVHSAFLIEGEQPANGAAWLRLMVGPTNDRGNESFDVCVCTPDWLRKQIHTFGPLLGRHHLIVNTMDIDMATNHLRRVIENKHAKSWIELATELSEIGYWEFEDYREGYSKLFLYGRHETKPYF